MPQRKQVSWAELRVGLFVLVGLAVLAAGIFYVTGSNILGPKYRIKTFLPEVSGLAKGASVKLDGVEIGNVRCACPLRRSARSRQACRQIAKRRSGHAHRT